jgi:hypothetical protein
MPNPSVASADDPPENKPTFFEFDPEEAGAAKVRLDAQRKKRRESHAIFWERKKMIDIPNTWWHG